MVLLRPFSCSVRRIHSKSFTIQLPADSFRTHNCDPPTLHVQTSKHELLRMYREMQTIRRMEFAAEALYKADLVRGYCHLAIGQEAVSIGIQHAIDPLDRLITAYRCHPFALLRGGSLLRILGELTGRQCGMSRGRGGSMHMFTPTFFGGNGIVGAQVPVGMGVGFAQRYKGEKRCVVVLYGDGASNQGQVFEAFNMAKLWNLPCIFICENNTYGLATSAARSSSNTEYFTRGDKIPGLQVNGMDALAIKQAVQWARRRTVDEQQGPVLLEFVTYRYLGHSCSIISSTDDPDTRYRTRQEIEKVQNTRDPIRTLRRYLLPEQEQLEEQQIEQEGGEEDLRKIERDVKKEVDEAVIEAKKSPEPDDLDLWADVYAQGGQVEVLRGRERMEVHRY